MQSSAKDIIDFWFEDTQPQQWFQVNPEFDADLSDRYAGMINMAADGVLDGWNKDADGCLALVLLLDQFPRNVYRDTPKAFENDSKALLVAKHAIAKGFDQILNPVKRRFLYLPFEHSENINDQHKSVELFESLKDEDPLGYDYAIKHFKVIDRFNRFPHRNGVLGRENTPEEDIFLKEEGRGF